MDAPARQVFRQALKTDTQISQRLDAYVVESRSRISHELSCHVAFVKSVVILDARNDTRRPSLYTAQHALLFKLPCAAVRRGRQARRGIGMDADSFSPGQESCRKARRRLTDLAGVAHQAPSGVASLLVTFLWPRREKLLALRRRTKALLLKRKINHWDWYTPRIASPPREPPHPDPSS